MSLSGGCQCGAVRFRVEGDVQRASVCHCRMCQKALGAPFGAFASVRATALAWTRGARKTFRSSENIARGFCGDCGTPLTFEAAAGGENIAITIAAFDTPGSIRPERQRDMESRWSWLDDLNQLPVRQAPADPSAMRSRQHPDHDTAVWPLGHP